MARTNAMPDRFRERYAGNAAGELRDRLRHRKSRTDPEDMHPRIRPAVEARQGRASLFAFEPAIDVGPWHDGGYPHRFLERAYQTLGVTDPSRVLHICSGGVKVGVTVDVRAEVAPRVIGDARMLPFRDATFDWAMADPPYGESYAEQLYGTGESYPRPSHILSEASRVLRPGGRVGILHFIVPKARYGLRQVGCWGVYTGPDFAIRAWTVYEKGHEQGRLLEEDGDGGAH